MVRLQNELFLAELANLYKKSKQSGGAVKCIMKKYDGRNKPIPRKGKTPLPDPTEYFCLIRASLKKKKISAVVSQADLNQFQQSLSNILKDNIDGLKKKVKKSKSKSKATQ